MNPAPLCSAALAFGLATAALAQEPKGITECAIQTQPGGSKLIQEGQARFEKCNPRSKAQRTQIPNVAYKTKLKIEMGDNEPPCVFTSWGGGVLREYIKAGQGVELGLYLAKDPAVRQR